MLNPLGEKLRAIAYRALQGQEQGQGQGNDARPDRPVVRRLRDLASTVNDLLGQPIRATDQSPAPLRSVSASPSAVAPTQAPVLVYFDGKDHRTRTKVEELLKARDIAFQVLDVSTDEAERSFITTAAKTEEFPIVVVAGAPVGGLAELMQIDVTGELKRRVFGQG